MRRSASTFRLAMLAAALTVPLAWGTTASGEEGWWGALDEGEAVSLADVMRGPREYRDRIITFFCVFHTADAGYKYYPPGTAFSEQRHINFSVWPDGAPVWEERTFKQGEMPFLYLRRTNSQRVALVRIPTYTRLEITGKIRDIVREQPTIEVFAFRATGHRLGKRVVKSVMNGNSFARAGTPQGYQLAARAFKDALQPDLPPTYAMLVRKLLADTLRKLGFHKEARRYENGESVGMPELPEPGKTTPQGPLAPADMPQPFNTEADTRARKPAPNPMPYGSPDGDAPTGALPPAGALPPTHDLPPAPLPPDELAPAGPRAPRVAPPPRGALPPPRGTLPPPAPSYTEDGLQTPRRPAPTRVPSAKPKKPSASARSGIPPKRNPRLSGVK